MKRNLNLYKEKKEKRMPENSGNFSSRYPCQGGKTGRSREGEGGDDIRNYDGDRLQGMKRERENIAARELEPLPPKTGRDAAVFYCNWLPDKTYTRAQRSTDCVYSSGFELFLCGTSFLQCIGTPHSRPPRPKKKTNLARVENNKNP